MEQLAKRINLIARNLALVGFLGLLVLAIMTTLDVLLRWGFSAPIHGVNDVSAVVMAVVICACIPANLALKQNIRIDVLGSLLPPVFNTILEVFASAVAFLVFFGIAWQFVPFTSGLFEAGDRTWVLAWPVWPWWLVGTCLLILGAATQCMVLISDIARLFDGRDAGQRPGS